MKKPPVEAYIILFLTGGFYIFHWTPRLMRAINAERQITIFDLDRIRNIIVFSCLAFFLLWPLFFLASLVSAVLAWIVVVFMFAAVVIYFGTLIHIIHRIAKSIHEIEIKQQIGPSIKPWLTILLFFMGYLAVPYLQFHVNKIEWDENQ